MTTLKEAGLAIVKAGLLQGFEPDQAKCTTEILPDGVGIVLTARYPDASIFSMIAENGVAEIQALPGFPRKPHLKIVGGKMQEAPREPPRATACTEIEAAMQRLRDRARADGRDPDAGTFDGIPLQQGGALVRITMPDNTGYGGEIAAGRAANAWAREHLAPGCEAALETAVNG